MRAGGWRSVGGWIARGGKQVGQVKKNKKKRKKHVHFLRSNTTSFLSGLSLFLARLLCSRDSRSRWLLAQRLSVTVSETLEWLSPGTTAVVALLLLSIFYMLTVVKYERSSVLGRAVRRNACGEHHDDVAGGYNHAPGTVVPT